MTWLERFFYLLYPSLLLHTSPWRDLWENETRNRFVRFIRIYFLLMIFIYSGYYFFLDLPSDKNNLDDWFTFRFSIAGICALAAIFYFNTAWHHPIFYKVPAAVVMWIAIYYQTVVTTWEGQAEYFFYPFGFIVFSVLVLRPCMLYSILFSTSLLVAQYPLFQQIELSNTTLWSAYFLTVAFVVIPRISDVDDVRYFVAQQDMLARQKMLVELKVDFNNKIRSFFPKVIFERIDHYIGERRMTAFHAIDQVLRPKNQEVVCIFSDIRGFTQSSKNLSSFVRQGVIPNVRLCTDAIEEYKGIPRKVGDLIFAYFDDPNMSMNVFRALAAGIKTVDVNCEHNKATGDQIVIQRYVLISAGKAIVGNLGGSDSSIEVTALGSPVNFLSRVDEITKHPSFLEVAVESDLVLCGRTVELLNNLKIDLQIKRLDLKEMGIVIRDFEETRYLWLLPSSEHNRNAILEPYTYLKDRYSKAILHV